MITSVSALLDRATRSAVLRDPSRKRVIVALHEAGTSVRDIAQSLNCSDAIVNAFLREGTPGPDPLVERYGKDVAAIITSKWISRHDRGLLLYRPPSTQAARARHRESIATHLSSEVRRWLGAIEMSDADRQRVIDFAGMQLDQSPLLRKTGKYFFYSPRVVAEIEGIWKPNSSQAGDRDFLPVIGRWLASWIRFWIWDPAIWNRALDMEFAHFSSLAQAA